MKLGTGLPPRAAIRGDRPTWRNGSRLIRRHDRFSRDHVRPGRRTCCRVAGVDRAGCLTGRCSGRRTSTAQATRSRGSDVCRGDCWLYLRLPILRRGGLTIPGWRPSRVPWPRPRALETRRHAALLRDSQAVQRHQVGARCFPLTLWLRVSGVNMQRWGDAAAR